VVPLPAGVTAREANFENGLAVSEGGVVMGVMARDCGVDWKRLVKVC
jgi:hypothetical protein